MRRPKSIARGVSVFPARTPTLPPATATNSYALGTRELLLVEPATPFEDEQAAWLEWARGLLSQGMTIRALVLTHHHSDHAGGAAFFGKALKVPIWAHEETASRLPLVQVDRKLVDGESIELSGLAEERWMVLHTPGHAPGHVCLWNEHSGVLVAGDMVASEGTIVIEPQDGDMAEYLRQLRRLLGLSALMVLPAHGDVIDEPAALFRRYIEHRLMRESKVIAALSLEPEQLDGLLPKVYADTSVLLWPIAKLSLEAHLIKLEQEQIALRNEFGFYQGPLHPHRSKFD